MSYLEKSKSLLPVENTESRHGDGRCVAAGCPIPAGISHGKDWICRFHYSEEPHDWPKITDQISVFRAI